MSTDKDVSGHLRVLRNRFSDKRLAEAARRREHLDYRSLKIGDAPGSGKVRFLLAQMHQNYYFGFFETVCALGGIILEQALMYRIKRHLRQHGVLRIRTDGGRVWVHEPGELFRHSVSDLLRLAYEEGLLRGRARVKIAHHLRWIRNMVVHEAMPYFTERDDGSLEMRVIRSRTNVTTYAIVRMQSTEVAGLEQKRGEITAYYCISRLRQILGVLLQETDPEHGVTNESSGSLFQWEQAPEAP